MHWSELVGGDLVISPPHVWQKRFNKSGIAVTPRIDAPVEPTVLAALERFDDYRLAERPCAVRHVPPTRGAVHRHTTIWTHRSGFMLPNPMAPD